MNRSIHAPRRFLAGLLMGLFLMAGCAQYQPLHSPQTAAPQPLHLSPVLIQGATPGLAAPLTRQLREALLHSPAFRLSPPHPAIPTLEVRITKEERRDLARDPQDSGRPFSFQDILRVELHWKDSQLPPPWGPDEVFAFDHTVHLYARPSSVEAAQAALPATARAISSRILQLLQSSRSQHND